MFSVATDTQLFAISTSKATEKVLNNLQQQEIYNIENSYYTQVQQNKQVWIIAAEAVLIQTLTLIPPTDFIEEPLMILIHTQSSLF